MQVISLNDPVLDRWLNESICVPDESFVPLNGKDKLFFRPLQESKGSLGVFLKEEVDPFRGLTGTKWLVHAADPGGIDLLRSKYEAAKLHLAVTESINFVVVKAMPIGRSLSVVKDRQAILQGLIQSVVKTDTIDRQWKFSLPTDFTRDPMLISSSGAPPLRDLQSRNDRADILLWHDAVYFVFYKKVEQLEGFPPEDRWFSPEARAAIRPTVQIRPK